MLTIEQRHKINELYNSERNIKRFVYRMLKAMCETQEEVKTSEIEKEIINLHYDSFAAHIVYTKIDATYDELTEICKQVKSILFELEKIGYVSSQIVTEGKAHFHAKKGGAKAAYAHSEWKSRFWRTIK